MLTQQREIHRENNERQKQKKIDEMQLAIEEKREESAKQYEELYQLKEEEE